MQEMHGTSVPTRRPQKITMIIIKKWGGRCLVSLPLLTLSRQHLACNATRRAPPQKTETTNKTHPARQKTDKPRPTTTKPANDDDERKKWQKAGAGA